MTLIGVWPGRDLASSLAALCFAIIKTHLYLGRISAVLRKQQAHCPGGLYAGQDCQIYRVIYCLSGSVYRCRMRMLYPAAFAYIAECRSVQRHLMQVIQGYK